MHETNRTKISKWVILLKEHLKNTWDFIFFSCFIIKQQVVWMITAPESSVNICCLISYLTLHRTTCSHSHRQKESVLFKNIYIVRYDNNNPPVLPCEQSLLFWNKNHTDDITSWSSMRRAPGSVHCLFLFILNNWKCTKHIRSDGGYTNSTRLSKLNWDEEKVKSNTRGRISIKISKV